MSSELTTIIGFIIGSQALNTFIQGWYSRKQNDAGAKKTDADAASTLVQSILQWQQTLTSRISLLETMIQEKDKIIEELKTRIAHLEVQIFNTLDEPESV